MSKFVQQLLAICLMAFGLIAGLYTGIWLMFIGGITQIINANVVTSGIEIAIGLLKIVFCELPIVLGGNIFLIGIYLYKEGKE